MTCNHYYQQILQHIHRVITPETFYAAVNRFGEELWDAESDLWRSAEKNIEARIDELENLAATSGLHQSIDRLLEETAAVARHDCTPTATNIHRWALVACCLLLANPDYSAAWNLGKVHEYGIGQILGQNPHIPYSEMHTFVWVDEDEDGELFA